MWCPSNVIGYLSKISMSKDGSTGYLIFPDFTTQKMNFLSYNSLITEKIGKCFFDIYFGKMIKENLNASIDRGILSSGGSVDSSH